MKCRGTKRLLTKLGVPFTEVDVTTDEAGAKFIAPLGHTVAPVVVVLNEWAEVVDHWSDHRIGRIEALAKNLAA